MAISNPTCMICKQKIDTVNFNDPYWAKFAHRKKWTCHDCLREQSTKLKEVKNK